MERQRLDIQNGKASGVLQAQQHLIAKKDKAFCLKVSFVLIPISTYSHKCLVMTNE